MSLGSHIGPQVTIEVDFRIFDDKNPHVYAEFVRLARLWKDRRGLRHLGSKTLYEVTRWNLAMSTEGDSFKLNNNYTALYARKMMAHEPDLAGLFELRKLAPDCRCSRCERVEARAVRGGWRAAR